MEGKKCRIILHMNCPSKRPEAAAEKHEAAKPSIHLPHPTTHLQVHAPPKPKHGSTRQSAGTKRSNLRRKRVGNDANAHSAGGRRAAASPSQSCWRRWRQSTFAAAGKAQSGKHRPSVKSSHSKTNLKTKCLQVREEALHCLFKLGEEMIVALGWRAQAAGEGMSIGQKLMTGGIPR